jgi:hypothetical protein
MIYNESGVEMKIMRKRNNLCKNIEKLKPTCLDWPIRLMG